MWVIPEENPEGRAFMAVIIVFLVLAAITVALRFWAKAIRKTSISVSDYACLLAFVLDVGLVVVIWGAFSHGWGEDITKFTAADGQFAAGLFVSSEVVWNLAVTAIRVSILLFYIQVFSIRMWVNVFWACIGINTAALIAVIVATCTICRPVAYAYNRTIPGGHCGDLVSFERYTAVWNLLADAALVILPMPILWRLQMSTRKKVGLTLILGMGTIICALTLTRVFIAAYYKPENVTKQNAIVDLITALEPIIGTINACLPFLPAIVERVTHSRIYKNMTYSFKSRTSASHSKNGTGTSGISKTAKSTSSVSGQIAAKTGKRNGEFEELSDGDIEL